MRGVVVEEITGELGDLIECVQSVEAFRAGFDGRVKRDPVHGEVVAELVDGFPAVQRAGGAAIAHRHPSICA